MDGGSIPPGSTNQQTRSPTSARKIGLLLYDSN
jgi:hypothetical protein